MPIKWPQSETDLAEPMIEHLCGLDWSVYAEVEPYLGGMRDDLLGNKRADMVCQRSGRLMVLELKTRLDNKVIEQANGWIGYAHCVAVVVPANTHKASSRNIQRTALRTRGIGLYEIKQVADEAFDVGVVMAPRVTNGAQTQYLSDGCRADNQVFPAWQNAPTQDQAIVHTAPHPSSSTGTAVAPPQLKPGSADGQKNSPFQKTRANFVQYVKDNPGVSLKEASNLVDHHWKTPRQFAKKMKQVWESSGIPGVRMDPDMGLMRFYPQDTE